MKKYKDLEILCEGNKTHTGIDAKVILNEEPIHSKLGISRLYIDITPETSIIKIYYFHNPKTGQPELTPDGNNIKERLLKITYPIKRIRIDYKHLNIESDNTPLGTKFFYDGKEITSNSGIIEFHTMIGDAETINKYSLKGC